MNSILLTDIIGFLIIFPFSRKLLFNLLNKKNSKKENIKKDFIEREYEDIEDDNDRKSIKY